MAKVTKKQRLEALRVELVASYDPANAGFVRPRFIIESEIRRLENK